MVEGKERPEIVTRNASSSCCMKRANCWRRVHLPARRCPNLARWCSMNIMNNIGALATRNHQQTQFEGAEAISGEELTEKYLVKNASCWACPIGCTRISKTEKVEGEGPEFESTWAFGAQCGIDDLPAIIEANTLCNDLGLGYHHSWFDDCLRDGTFRKRISGFRSALRTRRPTCSHH